MNATPTSKAIEPQGALARADEQLAHVYEQIARADEELTRVSEQVAKMERGAARPPSAGPGPQSPPRRPALRALVGLPLAAGIIVAALVLQSSYGDGAKLVVARWAPQLVSTPSLPPENPPLPAQSAPSPMEWPLPSKWPRRRPHHRKQRPWRRPHRRRSRRQLSQRPPIIRSCWKGWREISRTWNETSNSSRRTSNK